MTDVKARTRVSLPAEQVWATLSDHPGMSRWAPGVTVTLERPGSPTAHGVGAVRRVAGIGPAIREEVTVFERPRRLGYRALSGMPLPDYAGVVTIAPRHGVPGSVVTWQLSTSSRSRVARVALRVASRLFLSALVRAARSGPAEGR